MENDSATNVLVDLETFDGVIYEHFVRVSMFISREGEKTVWRFHASLGDNDGGTFSVWAKDPIELFSRVHSHLLSEELRRNGGQK